MRIAPSAPALAAALLTASVRAGCSDSTTAEQPHGPAANAGSGVGAPATAAMITIRGFAFAPAALTVRPGAKVTVLNADSTAHTVTASPGSAFDTGDIAAGATASFTAPTTPGTYPYICRIHQFMHAVLTVSAAG